MILKKAVEWLLGSKPYGGSFKVSQVSKFHSFKLQNLTTEAQRHRENLNQIYSIWASIPFSACSG